MATEPPEMSLCNHWDFAFEARRNLGQICFARIFKVRALLQVTRIFRRLAVNQARMCRGNHVGHGTAGHESAKEILHGPGVFIKLGHVCGDFGGLVERERLVVR